MPARASLTELARAIAAGEHARGSSLLAAAPALALTPIGGGETGRGGDEHFLDALRHQVYAGDTALHIAAAAYEAGLARELVEVGALVRAANRRGAQPLHYAADGVPGSARRNPMAQRETVLCLIEPGADPNAVDKNGTTPLQRAVRNRCAAAVQALLEGAQILAPPTGADPQRCSSHAGRLAAAEAVRPTHGTTTGDRPTPPSLRQRVTLRQPDTTLGASMINTRSASQQPSRMSSGGARAGGSLRGQEREIPTSHSPASAVSRRWRWGIAVLVVALGALIVPGAALARPFNSTLQVPTHRPHVGAERIRATATHNGRGLCGTVSYVYYWNGQKVSHQPGGHFCNGVWKDRMMWPKRAIGYRLTLGVVVKTRYGTDYDWWWIQVQR